MELARPNPLMRFLPWTFMLALLAGLLAFFNSAKSKESELDLLRQQNQQLTRLRAENEELKKTQVQADELARLRKENEELHRLRNEVRQLREEKQQAAKTGQTAQGTIAPPKAESGAQQPLSQQLQQLLAENERLRAENQQFQQMRAEAQVNACMNNLRIIEGAKDQWALENSRPTGATVSAQDLQPYLRNNALPACPLGGLYTLNAVGASATCSIHGHAIP